MKQIIFIFVVALLLIGGYIWWGNDMDDEGGIITTTGEVPVSIDPISHASMVLTWGNTTIYNDPVGGVEAFATKESPDIILVSDVHGDHLDVETLGGVVVGDTVLLAPQAVIDEMPESLAERATRISNGESITVGGISITAVPMYNLPVSEDSRHAKGRGNGYLLEKDGFTVYIAGDTAGILEMRSLTDVDIAFVPMNLPYTMNVEEASDAVLDFAPTKVYPYHYRGPDGLSDVALFKQLVDAGNKGIEVVQLDWYPEVR
jgi:L-ascorbate metabolism protein UlaG (beta-lactamase superfamily)